jgi:hypothetical protein
VRSKRLQVRVKTMATCNPNRVSWYRLAPDALDDPVEAESSQGVGHPGRSWRRVRGPAVARGVLAGFSWRTRRAGVGRRPGR